MPHKHRFSITRRNLLLGAGALPLSAGSAGATADLMMPATTGFKRVRLGGFDVVALLAGSEVVKNPRARFGLNATDEAFATAAQSAHIPADWSRRFFTPTLVNTGEALVLFDTGPGAVGLINALEAAGYFVEDVDVVVLSHMHADHIGGLHGPTTRTFPNARYVCGNTEFDAWDDAGNAAFNEKVLPLADEMTFVSDGQEVVPGITAYEAFGHTLGHMVFMVESEGQQLLIAGDFANHYVYSLAHPDWAAKSDEDPDMAAETRRRILDMLASERMPFIGYHMPWPGLGFVEPRGEGGFWYVPETYQLAG